MYDIAIIGAGIVGSAIARGLSKYKLNIVVLEKGVDVCQVTTKSSNLNVFFYILIIHNYIYIITNIY